MRKWSIIIFLFCISYWNTNAQEFRHSFSFLYNQNTGSYKIDEQIGKMAFFKHNRDFGVDYRLIYYLPKTNNFFVSTGIRLNQAQANVKSVVEVTGFNPYTSFMNWKFRWRELSAPLYIGKTFQPFNNQFQIDLYGGLGLGILNTASTSYRFTFQLQKEYDGNLIGMDIYQNYPNQFKTKFLTSLDAGFNFTPLASFPNLSLGAFVAYNVSKTNNVVGGGFAANATRGEYQEYYFSLNRRFTNITFTLTYSFGKKWKNRFK